jgi:Flp pilus assembly pilin Flp
MTKLFVLTQVRVTEAIETLRDREEGQGMTEYAVLVGAVIAMVLAVVGVLTGKISGYISGLSL